MRLFQIGQEVTPIKEMAVTFGEMGADRIPKMGEIYTVKDYPFPEHSGFADYMGLKEFEGRKVYDQHSFAPVISSYELEDLLEQQPLSEDAKHDKHLIDG